MGPLPVVTILLSLLGVVLGSFAIYIHQQIASSQGAYTSFCDINQELSCDAVLGSTYASAFGHSVAAWGVLGWLAALALSVWSFRSTGREAAGRATLLLAASGAILAISGYFLAVSVFVIGVYCPICLSLDATALALFAVSVMQVKILAPSAPKSWKPRQTLGIAGVLTVLALIALYTGQGAGASIEGAVTVDRVRREDPRFYAYYISLDRVQMPLSDSASKEDSPITIVEFSDFQCPYCRQAFFDLERALEAETADDISLHHRNFPLDPKCNPDVKGGHHAVACEAAAASVCAHRAGRGHEFDRALFLHQKSLKPGAFAGVAKQLGMDPASLERCMEDPGTQQVVAADLAAGKAAEISSTPTIFINGRVVKGALSPIQFRYAFAIERDEASGRQD